jgi:hypothetical protein
MTFRDLDEFLVVSPKVLTIRGTRYEFPGEVSGRIWLQLQSISNAMQQAQRAALAGREFDPDQEALSDTNEAEMMREMFGGVEEQMVADGCSSVELTAVFRTLLAWHLSGEEAAEAVWNAQGEAPAPNREERRSTPPAKASRRGSSHASSNAKHVTVASAAPGATSSDTGS